MKKYFILSDIHSFFYEMKKSLDSAGYQKENPEHILIVCGDVFDRGPETISVYNFLSSIPIERCILIRGNHEQVYLHLLEKSYPTNVYFDIGTVNTFCSIAQIPLERLYYSRGRKNIDPQEEWRKIVQKVAKHPITRWLQSTQWRNYYELGKYIFVHSFIPTKTAPTQAQLVHNWRTEATEGQWNFASWGCPWKDYLNGLFDEESEKGKVLVCGHWRTGDFFDYLNHDPSYRYSLAPIYYSHDFIGLDGGYIEVSDRNYHFKQNVLVINEDNMDACYDQDGNLLQ